MMKHLLTALALLFAVHVFAFVNETPLTVSGLPEHTFKGLTTDQFVSLSAAEVTQILGRDLTFREKVSLKAAQKAIKHSGNSAPDDNKVLLVVLALLIPPLAVFLHHGSITRDFWINLILTLLCGIPGIIHALIVIFR